MTKQEYAEYQERVATFLQRVEHVSTGPCSGCADCQREYDLEDGQDMDDVPAEPWFSWRPCEVCGDRFGGNREHYHGIVDKEIVHGSCCEDCVYYLNYGRLDDTTMLSIERSAE